MTESVGRSMFLKENHLLGEPHLQQGTEMGRRLADGSEARFAAYVEELAWVIGHADCVAPLQAYCTGLLLPCERKSVEPMAAVTAPARVSAQHQSMLHFTSQGGWSDDNVLGKVRVGGAGDGTARANRGVDHR